MDTLRYIKEYSLGSYYRMNNGQLEFQPMVQRSDYPLDDDWDIVEKDLVGSEICEFRGVSMTLNQAYEIIEKELNTSLMELQLQKTVKEMRLLSQVWDNEKVVHYPDNLMSFDDLLNEISLIELK